MKVKPKDIKVNLPIALMFDNRDDIPEFARVINTIIHGKVKVKCEDLGKLNSQYVGIFYLQRNNEFMNLRSEFVNAIEEFEIENDQFYCGR